MALDGVDISLCFPDLFIRFCGQRFLQGEDKQLALLCVQRYNDWLLEEWADNPTITYRSYAHSTLGPGGSGI